MSTNAILAYPNTDGTIHATYVHYDGYIEHTGRMLANHYNDGVAAHSICHAGYLSCVEPTLKESVENSVNRSKPSVYESLDQMLNDLSDGPIEYIYLWTMNGKWVVLSDQHNVYSVNSEAA